MTELPPIPDKEFFSIGEVSQIVQLPAYVLRYWESEFKLLRPQRRASNQRKYVRKDIELIFKVKDLLHNKKFTIAGAKKFLLGDKRKKDENGQLHLNIKESTVDSGIIRETKKELEEILKMLE
ncbi:MAG: MerR family transcriptional regulator [Endomicrobiales bacterium]